MDVNPESASEQIYRFWNCSFSFLLFFFHYFDSVISVWTFFGLYIYICTLYGVENG